MDYIVSHINTDFDSLASMVAASKLYPKAKMVFSGKLNNEVKAFMSFYKDIFPVFPMNQVDFTKVKRIIIVDTMLQKRIGKLGDLVGSAELHIYDHHVANEDLKGQVHQVEALGATVTMLVEKIKEEAVELSPIEATLLLLGIYSDTDCLTYPSTTARDAYAAAYLLGLGANLQIVRDFLGRPLEEMQKDILNTLLNSLERYEFNGSNVLIASAECEDYVEGLSILAFKIQDIENPDALFIVAKMGKRVHIVGRSKVDEVSVRDILEPFGGGGHQKAASAVIKNGDLNDIKAKLHDAIVKNAKPMYTARDLMSSPVKTIPPEMTIQQADRIMIRYGHTGVPIVDQAGKMQGIISRRDIDKARQHGLLNHPVKGFMSSNIVTITPDTNFQEIQKLIIEHDIGRLPVLDDGYIVGIVSRTDVLRSLYAGEHKPEKKPENSNFYLWRNVSSIMERLEAEIQALLRRIGQVGDEENTPVYVVGGFVRDLLMKRPNLDIDLVVEGNGAEFAAILAQKLGGEKTFESEFCTAQIMLPSGLKLDVATARREFYEYPAMLPQVEEGSLKQDLYRRDFTINAMAVQLNSQSYGDLIDFFGGQRDIYQKKIRVLYNLSFIEDPTRILRALRFEKRYNFTIEQETEFFIKQALKIDVL
ncbi:MAG: CBS domain-containing protein, partial [bacterium]